jgi:hypothetical protein
MRANGTFIQKVEEKIAKMRKDDAISYLRGTVNKGFNGSVNNATTIALEKILERVRGS